MQFLLPLASLLGLEVDDLVGRLKKNAIAWSAVALFGVIALAFILIAIANAAILAWGPIVGPLLVALGAIIIAVAIWAVMGILDGMEKRAALERRRSQEKTALATTAALTALPIVMQSPLVRKLGIPVGGALAAAFLLSRSAGHKSDSELID